SAGPIDVYSRVTVELTDEPGIVVPAGSPKAAAALGAALRFLGAPGTGVRLTIDSPLPRSKGMGSSTADTAGAIYAAAAALGREIRPHEVARLCLDIEPTDGSLFPRLALFDHRRGSLYEDLGPAPSMDIVLLDLGGRVDTLAYNAVDRTSLLRRLSPRVRRALSLAREGIRRGDLELIGQAALLSALAQQEVLPKPPLESVIRVARRLGAVGVNVGHSGTVIGVLFPPGGGTPAALASLRDAAPGIESARLCRLVDGGPRALALAPRSR
ncbi:MAG: GHMP kinase, partial [Chloroflexi bacterium]|nr:GHMP kinase [Chloroflexota bacterium]